MLRAGNDLFKRLNRMTHKRFETSRNQAIPLSFAEFGIKQLHNGVYTVDNSHYVKNKLTLLNVALGPYFFCKSHRGTKPTMWLDPGIRK